MTSGPDDPRERARLDALARYGVMDTETEAGFDDLVRLAAHVCGTPTALVSLVDDRRQWFKARIGLDVCETGRDVAFCAHALRMDDVLEVPDAAEDPRFADNPLVTGDPFIRFYAGAPLVTSEGWVLGTLCVIDQQPRRLDEQQRWMLKALARQVVSQLEMRRQSLSLATEVARHEVDRDDLARTRRHLDGVLENTDVVLYAKDLDGRYTMANPALARTFGRRPEDVLGRTAAELADGDDGSATRDAEVTSSGATRVCEEETRQADGSVHRFLATRFPLLADDGSVHGVGGVATDVTELLRVREQLAESESRWRVLVESSPVAVAVFDTEGVRFVYANAQASVLYGSGTAQDLVGRSYLDVIPAERREAFRERWARVAAGEPLRGATARIVGFDGRPRDVEIHASPVVFDGRSAIQAELRDVTARTAEHAALTDRFEFTEAVLDAIDVGVVACDEDGVMTVMNGTVRAWHDLPPASPLLDGPVPTAAHLFEGDGVAPLTERTNPLGVLRAGGTVTDTEVVVRVPGKPDRLVVCSGSALRDADGAAAGAILALRDVTAARAQTAALRESEARFRAAFAGSPLGMGLLDGHGGWSQVNDALARMLGVPASVLVADVLPLAVVHPHDRTDFSRLHGRALDHPGQAAEDELRLRVPGGRVIRGLVSLTSLGDDGPVLLQVQDVTEQRETAEELERRATHDAVTGLPNRTAMLARAERSLSWLARNPAQGRLAVFFVDLDGFKAVNDTWGHDVGDRLLLDVAQRLQAVMRTTDTVSRLGGDEFVVLGEYVRDEAEARVLAGRIERGVAAAVATDADGVPCAVGVTASVGLALSSRGAGGGLETAESLLRRADVSMYEVKRHHKALLPSPA